MPSACPIFGVDRLAIGKMRAQLVCHVGMRREELFLIHDFATIDAEQVLRQDRATAVGSGLSVIIGHCVTPRNPAGANEKGDKHRKMRYPHLR